MEHAENLALDHNFEKDLGERMKRSPNNGGFHYYNAKRLNVPDPKADEDENEWQKLWSAHDRMSGGDDARFRLGYSRLPLESNAHFSGIPVNSNVSSVHVPTNVFDGDPKVANAIKWSERLDRIFKDNYHRDPSLSWQYFASSTGFMRQYPATKWLTNNEDPDLYDARMREWYIKAAASPKELVILLDTSGSMTGLRKEIAKHVVLNILETLAEDDFVAIYRFAKTAEPLAKCFATQNERGEWRAELIQATNENLRVYQEALHHVDTSDIAYFNTSLKAAFELLHASRRDPEIGANCNQAIMLVTDGVPERYEELFKVYNMPHKPVRVFTYLIGREISDLKAANHMACTNRGN
jgi:voltage-dependent calcium channel alpha-2/delta-3